ncbi:MAG TPA: D-alanyl-D-alanine carboxypeptidase/D-alanyl-D-alanine-endopeptidase [Thermoanaerobaculia bacterium]|nr:D-alanyl-D-alanine carboxypeptidase/D-alanyl-D-alanine-endopeptidase [Thermoanaerobaculia bacterium]
MTAVSSHVTRSFLALLSLAIAISLGACASVPPAGNEKSRVAPLEARPVVQPTLSSFIERLIDQPPLNRAVWAISIQEEDGKVLYSRNAGVMMTPASNRKLFVSAAAAACWGFSRQFETEVLIDGPIRAGRLEGDLIIRGGGDPSLGGRYEYDRDRVLLPILTSLEQLGIRSISGGVVADVSRFDGQTLVPSWEIEDVGSTNAAPVDALTFNEGNVGVIVERCGRQAVLSDPTFLQSSSEVTCGDPAAVSVKSDASNRLTVSGVAPLDGRAFNDIVTVSDPALFAAAAVSDFLNRRGIAVTGMASASRSKREGESIATLASPPLSMLLASYLEESINVFGDMLYKSFSVREGTPATFAASKKVEREFLTWVVGIDPLEFDFADGSGLSTRNKVTSNAIIKLLRFMAEPSRRGSYAAILAAPGDPGTMRRRLLDVDRLYVKTGTLSGVAGLSGFIEGKSGRIRLFSIIVNNQPSDVAVRPTVDSIIRRIADF